MSDDPSPKGSGNIRREVCALVIEDDDDARELVADAIRRSGYTCETACDGREALEKLQVIRPSVIFVDLSMPVMNGAEFREEQRHHRDWLQIPTVVMTGTNDEPLLDLAIEETLHKPVSSKKLLEIVRRYADSARR